MFADLTQMRAEERRRRDDRALRARGIVGVEPYRKFNPDIDDDPVGDLDEDSLALLAALDALDGDVRAWDPAKHPRNPKGSPGGGKFKSITQRITEAVEAHLQGDGKGDPFPGFDREQLRKVAKARGIELKRGEDRDSIVKKLLDDLGHGKSDSPARKVAKKAVKKPRASLKEIFDREVATGKFHTKLAPEVIGEHLDGTYAGYHVKVTKVDYIQGDGLRFSGTVRDADGKAIGQFIRKLGRDDNGDLHVVHELLKVKRAYQGSGFQAEFNGQLIDWYRDSGVKYIKVGANIDIGGYTWARAGYDFADQHEALGEFSRLEVRLREITGTPLRQVGWADDARDVPTFRWDGPVVKEARPAWTRQQLRKAFKGANDAEIDRQLRIGQQFIDELGGKTFGDAGFPSAYELSQLGRWDGAGKDEVWVGKLVMLGSTWLGIMNL